LVEELPEQTKESFQSQSISFSLLSPFISIL